MEVPPIAVLVLAALLVGAVAGGWFLVVQRRALRGECAARRLTEAAQYRDNAALFARVEAAVREAEVLAAADAVLDAALAVHHRSEGGPA